MAGLKRITSEPLVGMALFSNRAKWRSSASACSSVEKKYLTGSGVVRDTMLRFSDTFQCWSVPPAANRNWTEKHIISARAFKLWSTGD